MAKAKKPTRTSRYPAELVRDLQPIKETRAPWKETRGFQAYRDRLRQLDEALRLLTGETAKLGKGLMKLVDRVDKGEYHARESFAVAELAATAHGLAAGLDTIRKWGWIDAE